MKRKNETRRLRTTRTPVRRSDGSTPNPHGTGKEIPHRPTDKPYTTYVRRTARHEPHRPGCHTVHALLAYRSKARYPLDVVQHIERLNGRQRIDVEPPYLVAYLDEHGVFQLEHAELYARKMFLGA